MITMRRAMGALLVLLLAGCQTVSTITTPDTALENKSEVIRRCPDLPVLTDQIVAESIHVSQERLAALKANRSLNNNDVCTMPEEGLKRAFARLDRPKADHPGEWLEFRNLQRRSEDGTIKADGLLNGIEQRRTLLNELVMKRANSDFVVPSAGIASDQWTSLGPGHVGGRIRTILIDPANTSSIWLGSVAGGIWHSTDAGATWNPAGDSMGNLSISSLAMDPTDSNVIYAGTGEGFYNGDAVRGAGIYKTTDGGATWNFLSSTNPAADPNWYYVNRLAISNDGATVLAATRYGSTSGGIYRSTDGGATWTRQYADGRVNDVRFDPNDPNKAAANAVGYNTTTSQYESHILGSIDGGETWVAVKTFTSKVFYGNRIELAFTKANPQILYASRDNAGGEVWKSADGGITWTLASTPGHLGGQGWYDNTIWADPTNAAHVVVGGLDLWRSIDGGATWKKISNWVNNMYGGYPDVPHADHHFLISDPDYNGTTNRKLYNGNDGGIFRAADITLATQTSGWETLNHGLAITQFYSGAGKTAAGGKIIGGTQDNGSQMYTGTGTAWQLFNGGDGGYSAVDSLNDNYFYGEYVYLTICRTTNRGTSVSDIYFGITDAGSGSTANFIAPFILDPNDNNRMLAGGMSLWQSAAVKSPAPAWTAIKPSIGSKISAIAVAEGSSDIAWVGHNGGQVYKTGNSLTATPTWTQVGSGTLPARMVNRILIDKDSPSTVYVAFGGYNDDNLYRTRDNGATWTNITGNLPGVPIFTIVRNPTNPSWLYAGTEVGLYTSQDGGASWFTTSDGPGNVEISELSWLNNSTLLVATHGRGMFRTNVSNGPLPEIKANGANGSITLAQSTPVSITVGLDPGGNAGQNADWWVAAETPFGWYSYVHPGGWSQGINLGAQTPLFTLSPSFEAYNNFLPAGDYTFYFGVDLTPNGTLDYDTLTYDSVQVHVTQ